VHFGFFVPVSALRMEENKQKKERKKEKQNKKKKKPAKQKQKEKKAKQKQKRKNGMQKVVSDRVDKNWQRHLGRIARNSFSAES
jgi:hypothetical protein